MSILLLGLSHRTAPVSVRERLAIQEARVPAVLQTLRVTGLAEEAVVLSTCNRVEIYAVSSLPAQRAFAELEEFLVRCHDYREPLTDTLYRLAEPDSVVHLFRVACGLDSMVLGETEILGQLKKAYGQALEGGFTGSRLNKVFQRAFNVAKHIRSTTGIQRGNVSVASVAVELAGTIFTRLEDCGVLVIGAGDTGEKVARALVSRGVSRLLVTNRSTERAEALAAALGGRPVRFEQWAREFDRLDIVISSVAAPDYVLDRARLESLLRNRPAAPLLLVDIAVPRNIDPAVNTLPDVYLYNVDDLQGLANRYLARRQEDVARCEAIIREQVGRLYPGRQVSAWAGWHPAASHA